MHQSNSSVTRSKIRGAIGPLNIYLYDLKTWKILDFSDLFFQGIMAFYKVNLVAKFHVKSFLISQDITIKLNSRSYLKSLATKRKHLDFR